MISITTAKTDNELEQILSLQQKNLPNAVSAKAKEEEGFVSVCHTFEVLRRMNAFCPHIIAKEGDVVVGYALCMDPVFENEIPLLKPMFDELKKFQMENFMVMGQICISESHRRKGIFKRLYGKMESVTCSKYEYIVTEVDIMNTRSLGAHLAIGFKTLCNYHSFGQQWELLYLRLK